MGLEISKLTRGFKASDLMGTNKIHIGTTFRDDIIVSTFQSRGVRNMPGLQESLNRTTLQPRTDSSDSLLYSNEPTCTMTEKRRAELVVRNAGFVESARDEEIVNQNRNMESSKCYECKLTSQ
jgi:hypothetical protein